MTSAGRGLHTAVAMGEKEQHLGIPVICAQRPAMVEANDWGVAWAPVLIENLHAVLRGYMASRSRLLFAGTEGSY